MTIGHQARDEAARLREKLEARERARKEREAKIRRRIARAEAEDQIALAERLKAHFDREREVRKRFKRKLRKQLKEAERAAEREEELERAERQERAEEIKQRNKRLAKRRWLAEGGTEAEFETQWPEMWQEHLKHLVVGNEGGEEARRFSL